MGKIAEIGVGNHWPQWSHPEGEPKSGAPNWQPLSILRCTMSDSHTFFSMLTSNAFRYGVHSILCRKSRRSSLHYTSSSLHFHLCLTPEGIYTHNPWCNFKISWKASLPPQNPVNQWFVTVGDLSTQGSFCKV